MPNWVYNTLSLKETKKGALKDFLNATLKMDGYDVQVDSAKDWLEKMDNNTLCNDYRGIWLCTFFKRPETYDKYDTTNYPFGERMVVGETIKVDGQDVVVTDEFIQEYKNASNEQWQKYGAIGWYDWNCKNLGCKWDTCFLEQKPECVVVDGMEELTFSFDTPWNDPLPIFEHICQNYPDLDMSVVVDEEQGLFYGEYTTSVDEEGNRCLKWTDYEIEEE